jgi:nitrogen fixation/metabolism regulation signal transduction histidine kinase
VGLLALLEREAGEIALENDAENNNALNAIRISLTVLATTATIITVIMWIVTRRKVSQPLDMLVEEARALDDGELK